MVAVNDGRIVKIGESRRLGRFVVLQDVYGNTYTYAHLGTVVESLPDAQAARRSTSAPIRRELALPPRDAAPGRPGLGHDRAPRRSARKAAQAARAPRSRGPAAPPTAAAPRSACSPTPTRPNAAAAGGEQQC